VQYVQFCGNQQGVTIMPERAKTKLSDDIRQRVCKEVEAALLPLGKIIAGLVEKELAVLKQPVEKEKKVKADAPAPKAKKTDAPVAKPEKAKTPRIKPAEILKFRKKWKLNRTMFGELFGVSCEVVKSWEHGEIAPAPKTGELILHVRGMKKKERNALVESVVAEVEEAVADETPDDLK